MGTSTVAGDDAYTTPTLAWLLHSLPHLNVTLHRVNDTFDPRSPVYLESLGILGSIPAAWLIFTLFVLLIYLLTRCCDHKTRTAKSISALKVTLAVVSVLCCAAVGLGLYGNDDLHNGFTQLLTEGRQVDQLVARIRNQTEAIERQLLVHAKSQLQELNDVYDEPTHNQTALKILSFYHRMAEQNNTQAASAAADIRFPLEGINLEPKIQIGEKIEAIRWPFTMAILSVLLVLCVVLLVGVARHSRCALIAFSVCGLLAVIASYLMASVYVASSVALGDLCTAPDRFLEDEASPGLPREILHYYTSCERARANPFTQRLREAKASIEGMRAALNYMRKPTIELFPRRMLEPIFSSLLNQVNEADTLITSLTALVDCRALNAHYLRGARAVCNVGLWGLTLMLMSAMLAGLLMTVLVWVDSHTWIYIRKKKDYQHVMEGGGDPYLPPPAASQAIAARTLQRSQGSSYRPDTPPPSYTSAMLHLSSHASAPPHEAQSLIDGCDKRSSDSRGCVGIGSGIGGGVGGGGGGGGLGVGIGVGSGPGAHLSHLRGHTLGRLPSHHHHHEPLAGPNNGKSACKEFPNFKGFKFDHGNQQPQVQQQQDQHQQQLKNGQYRTANIQKFSSLGRRPLPQTPDEKNLKQPPLPKVPTASATTSSSSSSFVVGGGGGCGNLVETPLNVGNFRSLQRGAWQDSGCLQQQQQQQQRGVQFRSLQRGSGTSVVHNHHHHHQGPQGFRSAKVQDQTMQQGENLYANSESERQLYAVTEL